MGPAAERTHASGAGVVALVLAREFFRVVSILEPLQHSIEVTGRKDE